MHSALKNKTMKVIFKKMCSYVKAPLKHIDSNPTWFSDYEWTEDQCDDFRKWFANYLYNNSDARFDYSGSRFKRSKKDWEKEFSWFNLMWGWKIKISDSRIANREYKRN